MYHIREIVKYVQQFHEDVDTMVIFNDSTWLFMDSKTGKAPTFHPDIEVSLIDEAVNTIKKRPFIFQL